MRNDNDDPIKELNGIFDKLNSYENENKYEYEKKIDYYACNLSYTDRYCCGYSC